MSALILASCSAAPQAIRGSTEEGRIIDCAGFGFDGEAYLVASPNERTQGSEDLYKLSGSPPILERLTTGTRLSWVNATDELVVVASARRKVDQLELFDPKKREFSKIPGLGSPHAFAPDINDEGMLLYHRVDTSQAPNYRFTVHTWDIDQRKGAVLLDGLRHVQETSWGQDGSAVALLQAGESQPSAVLIIGANGNVEEIPAGVHSVDLEMSSTGLIALSQTNGRLPSGSWHRSATVILDPVGTKRRTIEGWYPLSWSPDGRMLLLGQQDKLGVTTAPEFNEVVGICPVGIVVLGLSWVSRPTALPD